MMMRRALVFGLPALLAALPGSSAAQSWKKTFPGYTLEQIGPTNTANGRGVTRFVQKFNGGGQKVIELGVMFTPHARIEAERIAAENYEAHQQRGGEPRRGPDPLGSMGGGGRRSDPDRPQRDCRGPARNCQ